MIFTKKLLSLLKSGMRTTTPRSKSTLASVLAEQYADHYVEHVLKRIPLIQEHCSLSFDLALVFYKKNPEILNSMSMSRLDDTMSDLVKKHKLRKDKQHLFILKDFGFAEISGEADTVFEIYLSKSPQELLSSGILTNDPVKSVLGSLEDSVGEKIGSQLIPDVYMNSPLLVIHGSILTLLISTHFQFSLKEAFALLQKGHFISCSISKLHEALSILINQIGFEKRKLLCNPCIVHASLDSLPYYLNESGLAYSQVIERIKTIPWIVKEKPTEIRELEKIIQENKISNAQLKYIRTFSISSEKLSTYLKEIDKHQELKVLKCVPSFLKIIKHFDNVKINLENIKATERNSWSVSKLVMNTKTFEENIHLQQDYCLGNEAVFLLANMLDKPLDIIFKQLKLHPKSTTVSYHNAQLVVSKLLGRGITKEQIFYSLPIVLYNADLVEEILVQLESYPELQPFEKWKTHPGLVSLIVYYIEKRSFFNFDGIFLNTELIEDWDYE